MCLKYSENDDKETEKTDYDNPKTIVNIGMLLINDFFFTN